MRGHPSRAPAQAACRVAAVVLHDDLPHGHSRCPAGKPGTRDVIKGVTQNASALGRGQDDGQGLVGPQDEPVLADRLRLGSEAEGGEPGDQAGKAVVAFERAGMAP